MTSLLLLAVLCLLGGPRQAEQPPLYSQTYAIYIRAVPAGTETVTERMDQDGNRVASSEHDMIVTDGLETKRMTFETTMVFVKDTPVPRNYSCRYTSGTSKDFYEVTIKDGKITRLLSRAGNKIEGTAVMRPNTVIVDFNVFHHYDMLARLYDFKKGGRQMFGNYIPVIGNEVPLAVTWLGDSKLEYEKGSIPVRNFKIEFVGMRTGNFATDMKGRLVRLIMREQDLEVVRKDLLPEK
jgi:hypothetical protein